MIVFRDVVVRFGDLTALQGLSVDLPQRRVGVIGPNGGGKSTLGRLVNGLISPASGRVEVAGLDVARQGAAVRRKVGYLFTDPDAQIVMPTVAEDIAFSLRRFKLGREETRARVGRAIADFQLDGLDDRPAHTLSGGQKQLLALASVLVTRPEVLVADEPTTLLDLRNSRLMARVLADLPQQVLLVSHDLELVARCERVLCLDGGRLIADGEPAEVIRFYRDRLS